MGRAERGWAQNLLTWRWEGLQQTAEVWRAKYFIRGERHEVLAHAEVRDTCGRRRIDIGSFPSVALARAACERDAAVRCRRDDERTASNVAVVDVRISPRRRRSAKADKDYRPRRASKLGCHTIRSRCP